MRRRRSTRCAPSMACGSTRSIWSAGTPSRRRGRTPTSRSLARRTRSRPSERSRSESEHADEVTEGYPEWEVRVECHSHHDTNTLADKLEAEGVQSVRRWRYLLLGALDEDSARALAERIKAELPEGCTITVEGTLPAVTSGMPPNPFAVLGGLGL